MSLKNPLLDSAFLKKLHSARNRITYIKVTALNDYEVPVEKIEGSIPSGSINLDGASALRRTCSFTMVTDDLDINAYYWGLENKIKVEIGLINTIDPQYPDVVWLPQGVYIITGFNTTYSTNNWQISINGKDKMCLLNGDIGGSLPAQIDFGKEEYVDKSNKQITTTYVSIPIKKIIREMVHAYGNEPYHNIIIRDLDETSSSLMRYGGEKDIYFFRDKDTRAYRNEYCIEPKDLTVNKLNGESVSLDQIAPNYNNLLNGSPTQEVDYFTFPADEGEERKPVYSAVVFKPSEAIGYTLTPLTYSGDLIANAGESITSVLDKIVKQLGAYEYFYDLDGQFVFQRKPNYIQELWNGLSRDEGKISYVTATKYDSKFSFNFNNAELISSFTNNPTINNLKNDYSIWGTGSSVNGVEIPIHYRYAIDQKPTSYTSISVSYNEIDESKLDKVRPQASVFFTTEPAPSASGSPEKEGLLQIGSAFFKEITIVDSKDQADIKQNKYCYRLRTFFTEEPETKDENEDTKNVKMVFRASEYEYDENQKYYILDSMYDLDWREIIYRMALDYYQYNELNNFLYDVALVNPGSCINGYTGYEKYYFEFQKFWPDLYNPEGMQFQPQGDMPGNYWNPLIFTDPQVIPFWIDFLDADSSLAQYSVSNLGDRPKVVNEQTVNGIYYREVPTIMFTSEEEEKMDYVQDLAGAYTFITRVDEPQPSAESTEEPIVEDDANPGLKNYIFNTRLSVLGNRLSAQDRLSDLLYQFTYCAENVTISSIPIYYLEPNTRIQVIDNNSKINGEYLVSKISLPLAYNGMMSITATKAPQDLM